MSTKTDAVLAVIALELPRLPEPDRAKVAQLVLHAFARGAEQERSAMQVEVRDAARRPLLRSSFPSLTLDELNDLARLVVAASIQAARDEREQVLEVVRSTPPGPDAQATIERRIRERSS